MKTVLINCSPKKSFCASSYFIFLQKMFVRGNKVTEHLRTPADDERILNQVRDAQAVVFALPLYVDSIPSHVLRFLEKMEAFCRENNLTREKAAPKRSPPLRNPIPKPATSSFPAS